MKIQDNPKIMEFIRRSGNTSENPRASLASILKNARISPENLADLGKGFGCFYECYEILEPSYPKWLLKILRHDNSLEQEKPIEKRFQELMGEHEMMEKYFVLRDKRHIPESAFLAINGTVGNPEVAREWMFGGKTYALFQEYMCDGISLQGAKLRYGDNVPRWLKEGLAEIIQGFNLMLEQEGKIPQVLYLDSGEMLVSPKRKGVYIIDTNAPFEANEKYTSSTLQYIKDIRGAFGLYR